MKRNAGISILISTVVSFSLLGIGMTVLYLVNKSQQKSADLEKTNRSFFIVESGLEAAFYHHNARGQGTHFSNAGSDVAADAPASQTITFDNGETVKWTIRGRTKDVSGQEDEDVIQGLIGEEQLIEIPLYWYPDNAVTDEPDTITNITDLSFTLTFSDKEFDYTGDDSSGTEIVPDGFDFGISGDDDQDQALINWAISKIDGSDNLTTFIPRSTIHPLLLCDTTVGTVSGFYCREHLEQSIDSNVAIPGYIIPGQTETTLDAFYADDDSNNAKFKISFQPLLPFTSSDGNTKIRGIPWALEIVNATGGYPKNYYEAEVVAEAHNIQKQFTKNVAEKTALKGLEFLVLD